MGKNQERTSDFGKRNGFRKVPRKKINYVNVKFAKQAIKPNKD